MTTFSGWQMDLNIITGSGNEVTLTGIQRLTYKIVNNVEAKEECGTRYTTLVAGNYGVTGTLERFWTGSGIAALFGITRGEIPLEYCTLAIYPNKSSTSTNFIKLTGVKFDSWSMSQRPGAALMTETWEFTATGSATGSQ